MGSMKMRIKRKTSTIPFGYKLDEDDNRYLLSVDEELDALESILPMVVSKSLSLREGALWLSHKTGRPISHQGLDKILKQRNVATT